MNQSANKIPQPPKPARKLLGLFAKKPPAEEPGWQPAGQLYPRLGGDIAGLDGKGGIYALWHLGVRPQWLRVGSSLNLLDAVTQMSQSEILAPYANAGLYLAWAFPPPEQCSGIVGFLAARLEPALQGEALNWDLKREPEAPAIAYPLPPGTQEA